jgi:hypothetical protein
MGTVVICQGRLSLTITRCCVKKKHARQEEEHLYILRTQSPHHDAHIQIFLHAENSEPFLSAQPEPRTLLPGQPEPRILSLRNQNLPGVAQFHNLPDLSHSTAAVVAVPAPEVVRGRESDRDVVEPKVSEDVALRRRSRDNLESFSGQAKGGACEGKGLSDKYFVCVLVYHAGERRISNCILPQGFSLELLISSTRITGLLRIFDYDTQEEGVFEVLLIAYYVLGCCPSRLSTSVILDLALIP